MRTALAALTLALLALTASAVPAPDPLPRCPEDVVLVGTGDFHHGRWSAYQCGPAVDDMLED